MRTQKLIITIVILILVSMLIAEENNVIRLSWDDVAGRCRLDNLSLQMNDLDNLSQQTEVNRAWGSFMPSIDYQWMWSDDEAYPMVDNLFIHSLQFTFPIFTGGARYANLKLQKYQQKSLEAEFMGAEEGIVLQAMRAYYGVILADAMVDVYSEALDLAETNLRQVESLRAVGTATELAVKQARTRYFESMPQKSNAENQKLLALKQLKYLLNIVTEVDLEISDSLTERDFLDTYAAMSLKEFVILARDNRSEILQITQQSKMVDQQKMLALSQLMPSLALTAGSLHTAYADNWSVNGSDFDRKNSIGLAVQMPLFNGGSRYFDLKQAGYSQQKMVLLKEQVIDQIELDAQQSYYAYLLARDNLKSLEEAMITAEESLRLANIYFEQGMSNQTDVLGAQLAYTQNRAAMKNGIYNYNTSQLALLKAIGDLHSIWQ